MSKNWLGLGRCGPPDGIDAEFGSPDEESSGHVCPTHGTAERETPIAANHGIAAPAEGEVGPLVPRAPLAVHLA